MKIKINNVYYTQLKSLSFDPQSDVTGSELAINNFTADIITDDDINTATGAELYDDTNNLWASYWLTFAERIDKYTIHIKAESLVVLLGRSMTPAVMYNNTPVSDVISDIFEDFPNIYTLDSSFNSVTISGFCGEQSNRNRLQWVCFVIGAYVKSFFTDKLEILPIDVTSEIIPAAKTFWKPSISYDDYVTGIKIKAYSYVQGTPQATDTWVTDGTNYYIQSEQNFTLNNPDVPAGTPVHNKIIDDVTIINPNNVSGIISYLANLYFKRVQIDADIINNAEFAPGDRVIMNVDEQGLIDGYIESCAFTFGLQAKSRIKVLQMATVDGASLIIIYMYDNSEIGRQYYLFPKQYAYVIENPYLDKIIRQHRYIYYPLAANASGTVGNGTTTDTEDYEIALDFYEGVLRMYSVDDISQDGSIVEVA